MPLLEANELGCPVACSNFEGHVEMLQDAALYFKPSDTDEIARSMKQIMDPAVRSGLLERGICVKAKSIFTVTEAVKRINQYFMELISVRKTWQ
ncbi:MAG TPA: hypothetical protein VM012_12000, partial [Flavitalea sp.]|nr:hypothetical protein [Flavitalea sp.]